MNNKTFNFGEWSLTETRSVIGNLIINNKNYPDGIFSTGPLYVLLPGKTRRPLRDMWHIFRYTSWIVIHIFSLIRELKKLNNTFKNNINSLVLGDLILYKVFEKFCFLVHLVRGANRTSIMLGWSDSLRNEYDTLNNDTHFDVTVRCFNSPNSDNIQHLISSGLLEEAEDDEEVTHIEVTIQNSIGDSFVLGILKKN